MDRQQAQDAPDDALYRRLAENVEDVAILILDPLGRIRSWNRGAEKLKGYSAEEAIGRSFEMFYPADAIELGHPQRELDAAAAIGRYREEGWRVRKDGSRFWAEVIITAVYDADGGVEAYGKLTRDLTAVKQADEQRASAISLLETTALIDALTGLANRRAWDETLEREMAQAERDRTPFCVAMIDLDHFKTFNDQNGHSAGDRFLRRCAVIWRGALRPTDTLARYGGEEFSLALPGCEMTDAMAILNRMRELTPAAESCSAGVARWRPGESSESILGRADQALYQAKLAGRNQVFRAEELPGGPTQLSAVS